jgi:lipoprotein signal peptidase
MQRNGEFGQRQIAVVLLVAVLLLDQMMKWWAWRHVPQTIINDGGGPLVGATVGGWYANPVAGAVLDLLDFGLLGAAIWLLVRRRRPIGVLVPGVLMIGGWGSNLLDRLGMHFWTAPGSVRGAVDFIHLGHHYYNIADFFIIGATPAFLLGISCLGRTATVPAASRLTARTRRRQPRTSTRMSAIAGVLALVAVVVLGAVNYGGVNEPLASATASGHR